MKLIHHLLIIAAVLLIPFALDNAYAVHESDLDISVFDEFYYDDISVNGTDIHVSSNYGADFTYVSFDKVVILKNGIGDALDITCPTTDSKVLVDYPQLILGEGASHNNDIDKNGGSFSVGSFMVLCEANTLAGFSPFPITIQVEETLVEDLDDDWFNVKRSNGLPIVYGVLDDSGYVYASFDDAFAIEDTFGELNFICDDDSEVNSDDGSWKNINSFGGEFTPGEFIIECNFYLPNGNEDTLKIKITVIEIIPSNDPPVIEITGANPVTLTVGDTYVDAGATATDTEDDDTTLVIITTNNVDTTTAGSYTVDYAVTDSNGNLTTDSRTVDVEDPVTYDFTVTGDRELEFMSNFDGDAEGYGYYVWGDFVITDDHSGEVLTYQCPTKRAMDSNGNTIPSVIIHTSGSSWSFVFDDEMEATVGSYTINCDLFYADHSLDVQYFSFNVIIAEQVDLSDDWFNFTHINNAVYKGGELDKDGFLYASFNSIKVLEDTFGEIEYSCSDESVTIVDEGDYRNIYATGGEFTPGEYLVECDYNYPNGTPDTIEFSVTIYESTPVDEVDPTDPLDFNFTVLSSTNFTFEFLDNLESDILTKITWGDFEIIDNNTGDNLSYSCPTKQYVNAYGEPLPEAEILATDGEWYSIYDDYGKFSVGSFIINCDVFYSGVDLVEYFSFQVNVLSPEDDEDPPKKRGSGGCSDCTPPTLGLDKNFKRIVDNGFSYNGNVVNVEKWHTEYPLINATVGEMNKVEIIVYENGGINNMKYVQFGLGAEEIGQSLSTLEVLIEVHLQTFGNLEDIAVDEIIIIDKDNLIDNDTVTAVSHVYPCTTNSNDYNCVKMHLEYSYREATINHIMVVNYFKTALYRF